MATDMKSGFGWLFPNRGFANPGFTSLMAVTVGFLNFCLQSQYLKAFILEETCLIALRAWPVILWGS